VFTVIFATFFQQTAASTYFVGYQKSFRHFILMATRHQDAAELFRHEAFVTIFAGKEYDELQLAE
tara:strand:+ start:432 stop:626 length:195 start_codon:yes stop_codon:yes gene_type:complete